MFSPGLEVDSCEKAFAAVSRTAQFRNKSRPRVFVLSKITSILCHAQDRRQILRKARAWQNFVASCRLSLSGQLCLHVRQESDHADVLARLPQLFNRLERLAARVQVHDDEFWR